MLSSEKPVLISLNPEDSGDCERCAAYRKKFVSAAKVVLSLMLVSFALSFGYVIYQAFH